MLVCAPPLFAKLTTALTLSFVTSVEVDAATITMPTVQTGDFVLLADMPARTNTGASQPDPTAISGLTFTALTQFTTSSDAGGATRNVISSWCWGRIVANGASESGTVLTGSNTGVTAGFRRKILLVFRGSAALSSFTVKNASKVWDANDPAATSTALTGVAAPFLSIGTYRAEAALVSPTLSPAADGSVDSGTTARVAYTINNTASVSTLVADMGDSGQSNILTSFAVELT